MIRLADFGALVVEAEHGDAGPQDVHRAGVLGRVFDEINDLGGQIPVEAEFLLEIFQFLGVGEPAVHQQVVYFAKAAVCDEVVDVVTEVGGGVIRVFCFGDGRGLPRLGEPVWRLA